MKFSNVRLLVRDYEKCFRFYTEKLGLEAAFDIEGCYGSFKVAEGIEGLAIFTSGWGMRVVHLRDPEENLIELFTPLAANL